MEWEIVPGESIGPITFGSRVQELEEALGERSVSEWIAAFAEAGVPAGPINTVSDAFGLAERLGLGAVGEDGAGFRGVRSPIRFGGTAARPVEQPPALDADGDDIRRAIASGMPLLEWLERPPQD